MKYLLTFGSKFALLLLLMNIASAQDQKALKHPGRVIDFQSKNGISTVISAYDSNERVSVSSDCVEFKNQVQKTESNDIGNFSLTLPTEKPWYLVTYCRNGYYPREEGADNSTDGSQVRPFPVELLNRSTDIPAFKRTISDTIDHFLANLSYLRSSRKNEFDEALKTLSKDPEMRFFIEGTFRILEGEEIRKRPK